MKIPIVKQHDIKDCGACSLLSIIKYYGGYVPVEKIREDTNTTKEGTSVYHLKLASSKYGFDAIAKKYSNINSCPKNGPIIIHVKYENGLNHFMVLYKINKNKCILMDPAKGKIVLDIKDLNLIFTGVVLELYPKTSIVVFDKSNSVYKLFVNIILKNKKLCLFVLLSSLLCNMFTIINSFYFKIRYELLITNQYYKTTKLIIYLFLIVLVFKVFYEYMKSYYENYLNKNIDFSVYQEFIYHIFHLPLKVINTRTSGEIITRIKEVSSIKDLFSQILIVGILDSNLFICSFIILIFINLKISLIMIGIVLIYFLVSIFFNKYIYIRIKENIEYETKFNDVLIQNIDMIESAKNLNKIDYFLNKIECSNSNYIIDNYSFFKFINLLETFKNFIVEIGIFLINSIGFYLITKNELKLTDLIVINSLIFYLIDPVKNLINILLKYEYLKASFDKICEFIDLKEEKNTGLMNIPNGDVEFQNVSYSYNMCDDILSNVSFKINSGDKVFIEGPSGSGKSTICNLIEKNIIPSKGNIIIANNNLEDYSAKALRNNIIYIGQHEKLFTDTIKNNIMLNSTDEKRFNKICKICLIEDIVKNKPLRYESGIDNSNVNISGGEKQRIVLARALMNNRKILIIDEALSETDYKLESQIIKNILKEFKNQTIIYISHKNQERFFDYTINIKDASYE